jgi:hypothetical protein
VNLQARYFDTIRQTFGDRGSNSDTRALVGIPFQHFFTSNYDPSLEVAHAAVGKKYDSITLRDASAVSFLNGVANYEYTRNIVHVHGIYTDPQNIILTKMEYDAFYAGVPVARRFWEIFPVARQFVFLGFSFSDIELTEKFYLRQLSLAHRDHLSVGHFALLALNDPSVETAKRAENSAEYGFESVFFDPIDTRYTGLSNIIQEMANTFRPDAAIAAAAVLPAEIEVMQQADPNGATEAVVMDPADVTADVQQLERLTAVNLRKRSTGDLQ